MTSKAMRAYFPFQNDILDHSGNGCENTYASAVYTFGAGHAGDGIRFDGSSDNRLVLWGAGATPIVPASGGLSLAMWVYKAAGNSSKEYIASVAGSSSDKGYRLYFTDDGRVRLLYYDGSTTVGDVSASVDSQAWLHIAFTWSGVSGDSLNLYVNGALVDTDVISWTRNDDEALNIARRRSYAEYGDIRMQHLMVFDQALSQAEITRLYMCMHAIQH